VPRPAGGPPPDIRTNSSAVFSAPTWPAKALGDTSERHLNPAARARSLGTRGRRGRLPLDKPLAESIQGTLGDHARSGYTMYTLVAGSMLPERPLPGDAATAGQLLGGRESSASPRW